MLPSRLRFVDDICPLQTSGKFGFETSRWYAESQPYETEKITLSSSAHTTNLLQNRLFSWQRTFTADEHPTESLSTSFIQVREWVPAFHPTHVKAYVPFGLPRTQAIAFLPTEKDRLTKNWSATAKRHTKSFHKHHLVLRMGHLHELKGPYCRSQVPKRMQGTLWNMLERHIRIHEKTVDVFVVENTEHEVVAAFVSGNCEETKTGLYLFGFFLPEAKHQYPMYGLVEHWFHTLHAKGFLYANFGDISGPHSFLRASERGYSLFKTQFGTHRVWLPESYWNIRIGNLQVLPFAPRLRYKE